MSTYDFFERIKQTVNWIFVFFISSVLVDVNWLDRCVQQIRKCSRRPRKQQHKQHLVTWIQTIRIRILIIQINHHHRFKSHIQSVLCIRNNNSNNKNKKMNSFWLSRISFFLLIRSFSIEIFLYFAFSLLSIINKKRLN